MYLAMVGEMQDFCAEKKEVLQIYLGFDNVQYRLFVKKPQSAVSARILKVY
jgi:hypothetical protein